MAAEADGEPPITAEADALRERVRRQRNKANALEREYLRRLTETGAENADEEPAGPHYVHEWNERR